MLQLSLLMQKWVKLWVESGHRLDEQLLIECAYYPRGGCQYCSWDNPRPQCQWSHLLSDTRMGAQVASKKVAPKGRKVFGRDVEELFKLLTPQDRERVERILKGGGDLNEAVSGD